MVKLQKHFLLILILIIAILPSTYFAFKFLTRPVYIFLSPHLDDAALSAGAFIFDQENQKIVVTFFTQKPAKPLEKHWDQISGFKDSSEAIDKRKIENQNAMASLKSEHIELDNLDFQYRKNRDIKGSLEMENDIKIQIENLLKEFKYRNIHLFGPSEFGNEITHPDHKALHNAFKSIAKSNKDKKTHFYFYEDFPYTLRFQRQNETTLKGFMEKQTKLSLLELPYQVSTTSLKAKIDSIRAYKSQDMAFQSMNEDITKDSELFTNERCKDTTKVPCEVYYLIEK